MVRYCFDGPTSHKIVVFATEILERAAKASVTELIQIVFEIKDVIQRNPGEA